jgi:hypothetical protein
MLSLQTREIVITKSGQVARDTRRASVTQNRTETDIPKRFAHVALNRMNVRTVFDFFQDIGGRNWPAVSRVKWGTQWRFFGF